MRPHILIILCASSQYCTWGHRRRRTSYNSVYTVGPSSGRSGIVYGVRWCARWLSIRWFRASRRTHEYVVPAVTVARRRCESSGKTWLKNLRNFSFSYMRDALPEPISKKFGRKRELRNLINYANVALMGSGILLGLAWNMPFGKLREYNFPIYTTMRTYDTKE